MDQISIGNFIAKKRRERNFTQEKLAERLGVSNKTISKWECGKCMPDYSVVEVLCSELGIGVSELIRGAESYEKSMGQEGEGVLSLYREIGALKTRNVEISGAMLLLLGLLSAGMAEGDAILTCAILYWFVAALAWGGGLLLLLLGIIKERKREKKRKEKPLE